MQSGTTRSGDLEIEIGGTKPMRVIFRGKSNLREPAVVLRPLFAEILKNTSEPGASVELHFEELEFFNSSTITSVIQFIKELRSRRVSTRVVYDSLHKWQKVFFDALGMLQQPDGFLQITPVPQ